MHLEAPGVSMQQWQEPGLHEHVLRCGQDKNFPQAKRRGSRQGSKLEALCGGDPGFTTSQPGRKGVPPQDVALEEVLGSKSSQTLSQGGLSPPESLFRIKMKCFFQWLHPGVKCEQQENPQEKGSPVSSAGSRGPDKSTRALTGPTEGPKVGQAWGSFYRRDWGVRWNRYALPSRVSSLPSEVWASSAEGTSTSPGRAHPGASFQLQGPLL